MNGQKGYAPISGRRMKVLRGPKLTAHQKASVSKLGNAKPDQRPPQLFSNAFDKAAKMIAEIDALEAKLADPTYKRARYKQRIRRLNNGFARLTERSSELWRLGSEFAEKNGGAIENIMEFTRWLRERKKLLFIQDHAVRTRIKNTFGIEGKRGRPRRS